MNAFGLEHRSGGWTLTAPGDEPFLSIGLNHADEANLRYPHNIEIWRERYGSREAWIRDGIVADLREWGFNTVGWTQEHQAGDWGAALDWFGDPIDLQHSSGPWAPSELRGCGMPYVVQLRVQEIEDWNGTPHFRRVDDDQFRAWCAYLARTTVQDHADSENLLGYFLVDIPAWLPHQSGADFPELEGHSGRARDTQLYDVASRYYETITAAIRAIDPDHLILGDRYNGNKGIPDPVLRAIGEHVDVLSVQYFTEPTEESRAAMREDFARWHEISGLPVLNADIGNWVPTELNPRRNSVIDGQRGRGEDYAAALGPLLGEPWFLGWHWCAYVENLARGWGLKDPWDDPYRELTDQIQEFNGSAAERWRRERV